MARLRRPGWIIAALVVLAAAAVAVVLVARGGDEAQAQTVRFQKPTEAGPDPFTKPADVHGSQRVQVGSGPFGGTGSDLVCNRELLIRSLKARPDRLREWARVVGVEPSYAAVARYIRRLRPVTLTRDTRVTNHSFVDGRAVPFQAILQAGTAVLVDKDGTPVARCRCGNPLTKPVFYSQATCNGCPPHYRPPRPCRYHDYNDSEYRQQGDDYFKQTYNPNDYRGACYRPYLNPPKVALRVRPPPEPTLEPAPPAPAAPSPPSPNTTPTLDCSAPRSQAEFERCNPPQTTPQPQPQPGYDCPEQPPAHPGEDYLRNCR